MREVSPEPLMASESDFGLPSSKRPWEETMNESAWEPHTETEQMNLFWPCEQGFETPNRCGRPSTWRLRRSDAEPFAEWLKRTEYLFVCDEHKVEPQPPSYEEWLAQTAVPHA